MPELPETETIARDLDGALRGAVVRSATVLRADVLRDPGSGRRPRAAAAKRLVAALQTASENSRVHGVHRRAKSVLLALDSNTLVVTPRFTGALLIDAAQDERYDCLRFDLADGRTLTYRDVRRLGTVMVADQAALEGWQRTLGPEPLDPALTAERFSGILRASRRAVKSVLMDQRRLAGVGNIYANEALWRAAMRPARAAHRVTSAEAARLLDVLRATLTESIALRGTTFRDYQDAYGGRGGFAAHLAVYGRGGERCLRCGATLRESHAVDGRSSVWCAECQR